MLSVRQPVSGSSDSFSAPWVCLLLNRGRGESGEKRKEYSIHTGKKLNLKYPAIQHIMLYNTAVSDGVFMLTSPKCVLCIFSYWTTLTNALKKKKTKIPFAFYARRKRETLRWYSHGLDVYVSGRLDHMSITAPIDKTT